MFPTGSTSLSASYDVTEEWLTTTVIDLQPTPIPTPEQLGMGSSHISPTPTPEQLTTEFLQATPTPGQLNVRSSDISATVARSSQEGPSATVLHRQDIVASSLDITISPTIDTVNIDVTSIVPSETDEISTMTMFTFEVDRQFQSFISEPTPVVAMTTVEMEPTPTMSSTISLDDVALMSTIGTFEPSSSARDSGIALQRTPLISESTIILDPDMITPTSSRISPTPTSSILSSTSVPTPETTSGMTTLFVTEILENTTLETSTTPATTSVVNDSVSLTTFTPAPEETTKELQTTTENKTNFVSLGTTSILNATTEEATARMTTLSLTNHSTTMINLIPVNLILTLDGDCQPILAKKEDFKVQLIKTLADYLAVETNKITVNKVQCGSVISDVTVLDNANYTISAKIEKGNFTVKFDNKTLTAKGVVFVNGPFATTTPVEGIDVTTDDDGGILFIKQQMLIYYIIGGVVGLLLVIVVIVLMHHCVNRKCQSHARSFNPNDGPVVKLSDFNMAHTFIPRPRSVYSEGYGSDGKYLTYGSGFNSSHSSAYYSSEDDLNRQCEQEIPTETIERFSNEFGHSVPEWNLPRIEGGYNR